MISNQLALNPSSQLRFHYPTHNTKASCSFLHNHFLQRTLIKDILWSIRFRLHTLFLLGGDTFVLTCLSYIQQTCRDENIPHSMPSEGINPEFFYFGKIVWLYNSILLNALQFIPNFTR